MPENKYDFRKSLSAVIDVRSREATRQRDARFQHQLIGSFTKRP
jgi:hypothetical protein